MTIFKIGYYQLLEFALNIFQPFDQKEKVALHYTGYQNFKLLLTLHSL